MSALMLFVASTLGLLGDAGSRLTPESESRSDTIHLLVLDEAGTPVGEADLVVLAPDYEIIARGTSDATGALSVDIEPGTYTVQVAGDGLATVTVDEVRLTPGSPVEIVIPRRRMGEIDPVRLGALLEAAAEEACTSAPGTAPLFGFVTDATGMTLIEGARVVVSTGGGPISEVRTDATGFYSFCVDRSTRTELTAFGETGEAFESLSQNEDDVQRIDLALREGAVGESALLGRVLDQETREFVPHAMVREVTTGRQTETNSKGFFVLERMPTGLLELEIEHLGYGSQRAEVVVVSETQVVEVAIHPEAIELPGVTVSVAQSNWGRDMTLLYERMDQGWADYVMGPELNGASTFSEVVQKARGVRIRIRGRRRIPIMAAGCEPKVWVDGNEYELDPYLLWDQPMPEAEIVEVFTNFAGIPPEYRTRGFGVVKCAVFIWTKRR